ncbi:hypothetical protein P3S68_024426 [Capsicum galapagoense]
MSFREMSMDSMTEEDLDSFDSNTDAIIYDTSDHSGESMISGPNISSSSSDDEDRPQKQQISTAAPCEVGTDFKVESSCASSSWFMNNNKQIHKQEAIMIFNVDFRTLSSKGSFCNKSDNEVGKLNLNSCGKRVREGENEDEVIMRKKDRSKEQMVDPLTPLNWSSFWKWEDDEGTFEVPPLSPLSPHPNLKRAPPLLENDNM